MEGRVGDSEDEVFLIVGVGEKDGDGSTGPVWSDMLAVEGEGVKEWRIDY